MKIHLNKFCIFLIIIFTSSCTLKNPEHYTGDNITPPKKVGVCKSIEPVIIPSTTPGDALVSFKIDEKYYTIHNNKLFIGSEESHVRMNKEIYDLNKNNSNLPVKIYFLQCGSPKGKYASIPPPTLVVVHETKGKIKVGIVKRNDLQILLKNKPKLEGILKDIFKKYGFEDEALKKLKSPQFKKEPTPGSPTPTPAPATPEYNFEAFIKEIAGHVSKWHKIKEKGIKGWNVIPIGNDKIMILMNFYKGGGAIYLMKSPKSPKKSEMPSI